MHGVVSSQRAGAVQVVAPCCGGQSLLQGRHHQLRHQPRGQHAPQRPSYKATAASGDVPSGSTPQRGAPPDTQQWDAGGPHPPSRSMLAAMAMSPLAALSLPLINDPAWQESAAQFAYEVRSRIVWSANTQGLQDWVKSLDESITFMDWTYKATGIDLTYIWDPELWLKFKQAVWTDQPAIFWNGIADRIEYKSKIPQAGLAGDMRISYGKFLQLLEADRIKRVVIYGDMKTAIIEVPHPWYASTTGAPGRYPHAEDHNSVPISLLVPNPAAPYDPMQWYCPEMPEWNMEKYRFYLDLPGDFWQNGVLLRYLRDKDVQVVWDGEAGQYLLPHKAFTKVLQVRTEVQVLDPSTCWDFMDWFTHPDKLGWFEGTAGVCVFCRATSLILDWSTGTPIVKFWDRRKKKKKSREETTWERITKSTARQFGVKDAKTGKKRDTGVRFDDIAGMEGLIVEMKELVRLLLNDPAYVKVGAKLPRGILFQGPPGTGKTYLARAIAGEASLPFFSAVGSEFIEMFAGVASARVNNLFSTARAQAPAIIFIDEIDAIGRARSTLGGDPGSMERESALLAMLVQMDGIHGKLENVLTIGATNMASDLDGALLRPGRFEVVYEIPNPGPSARIEIMKFHAKNKKLDDPDVLLKRVAGMTEGWSAASLANLMNEAAILTVRKGVEKIDLPLMTELIENLDFGGRAPKLPPGEAKNRLAVVTAAKAVAFALTPGMEMISYVTLWSKRTGLGPSVEFTPSEFNMHPEWHPEMMEIMDWDTNLKVNAATIGDEKLGEFLHIACMLVPLYAPRAAEVEYYGPEAASLVTAAALSECFGIAYYCVRNSQVHPRFKSMPPLHTVIFMGSHNSGPEERDPLALGFDEEFGYHKLTLTLLKASWRRAQRMMAQRRTAVIKVAEALLSDEEETISGEELVAIIESTELDDDSYLEPIDDQFLPLVHEVLGQVPGVVIESEAAAPLWDVMGPAPADADPAHGSDAGAQQEAQGLPAEEPADQQSTEVQAEQQPEARAKEQQPEARAEEQQPQQQAEAEQQQASEEQQQPDTQQQQADTEQQQQQQQQPEVPEIRLTQQQLLDVSRALMGRLDIVDLVGKNTALEIAERVKDSLLQPEMVKRLQAVRRWVEQPDAAFPPPPLAKDVPMPIYGLATGDLQSWVQKQRNVVSWSAIEMVYNERQLKYFREDADMPADAQTPWYVQQRQEAARKAQYMYEAKQRQAAAQQEQGQPAEQANAGGASTGDTEPGQPQQ